MHLLALEAIDVHSYRVLSLCNLSAQIDLLLVSRELLLLDPTVDSSQLGFHAGLEGHYGFVFPLELSFDDRVHGGVAVSHLLSLMLRFFKSNLIFHVHLELNLVYLAHSVLLLE